MKRILLACLSLICAVSVNSVAGATVAPFFGATPEVGAVAGNVISLFAGNFIPAGVLPATVFKEIWTGEMIKAFRPSKESQGWYDRIKSYDQYVNNDVIHFTELGGDPDVLVNNTTYPIDVQALEDADKPISLDFFDTTATPVTDSELHACSYDKMGSVLERHKEAIREKMLQKALHAIAPRVNVDGKQPVIFSSGESVDQRKRLTIGDLLKAKQACDAMKMPKQDRILVLCSEHVNDLLQLDQKFREQYNINQTEGRIGRLYGFDVYEYDGTPWWDSQNKNKVAFDALPDSTHMHMSVFFYAGRMMKANGSVQFYHSEAAKDTLYHRNLVNFRKWGICLPLKADGAVGAIA